MAPPHAHHHHHHPWPKDKVWKQINFQLKFDPFKIIGPKSVRAPSAAPWTEHQNLKFYIHRHIYLYIYYMQILLEFYSHVCVGEQHKYIYIFGWWGCIKYISFQNVIFVIQILSTSNFEFNDHLYVICAVWTVHRTLCMNSRLYFWIVKVGKWKMENVYICTTKSYANFKRKIESAELHINSKYNFFF